jgi:hypothetical protein
MLLLRTLENATRGPEVWTAQAQLCAEPEEVLRALTDPEMIAAWAPISFDVDGLAGGRLHAGSRARVSGTIAGVGATFEVEVARADTELLELVANGPVSFEVTYRLCPRADRLQVDARVALPRGRGLTGQLLRTATVALLNAGALGAALRRLERSVSCPLEPELLAA